MHLLDNKEFHSYRSKHNYVRSIILCHTVHWVSKFCASQRVTCIGGTGEEYKGHNCGPHIYSKKATACHVEQYPIYNCPLIENKIYRVADKSLARPGRKQAIFRTFYGIGGSLPHSEESTTCPYISQISPFLCPSHFWQAQLVSFLVGLRTYQHPGIITSIFQ